MSRNWSQHEKDIIAYQAREHTATGIYHHATGGKTAFVQQALAQAAQKTLYIAAHSLDNVYDRDVFAQTLDAFIEHGDEVTLLVDQDNFTAPDHPVRAVMEKHADHFNQRGGIVPGLPVLYAHPSECLIADGISYSLKGTVFGDPFCFQCETDAQTFEKACQTALTHKRAFTL